MSGATCSAEQLVTTLQAVGAPNIETALRFEALWGGGWGGSLTLGPFAVLRELAREPEDREWVARLGERGLVLVARLPDEFVAIDAAGALHTAPRDGTPERIADDFVTLLERHALVSAASVTSRLAIEFAPPLGAALGAPVPEATDSVGAVWQSAHAVFVEGAPRKMYPGSWGRDPANTLAFTVTVDDAAAVLAAARGLARGAAIHMLRPVIHEVRDPADAPMIEAIVHAAREHGAYLPSLGGEGGVCVIGDAPPFRLLQVGGRDGRALSVLQIEGNSYQRTSFDAADLRDVSEAVRRRLAGARYLASLQTTREALIEALHARGLPALEAVLAFQARWGGVVFDEQRAALGTYAVIQRGSPDVALAVEGGRSAICIGYVYPRLLAVSEEGTFLVLWDDLDHLEEPLVVAAEASDAEGMLEALAK
jgi:hypothetical protein